jgi:anti-sigma-K factor RskA
MKKIFTSSLTISSLLFAPALKADGFSDEEQTYETWQQDSQEIAGEQQEEEQTEELAAQPQEDLTDDQDSEGTPVGQAASDGSNAAKSRQWRNIAIATAAVAVAVTALILIANNNGHHHHKGDH